MKLLLAWTQNLCYSSYIPCINRMQHCLSGRGIKTAWNTWKVYPKLPRHLKSFSLWKLRPVTWLWKHWNGLWCCVMTILVTSALIAMQGLPDPANWGWRKNTTGWDHTVDHNFRSVPSMLRINSLWMQERVY